MKAHLFVVCLLWITIPLAFCQVCNVTVTMEVMYYREIRVSYSQAYDCGFWDWSSCYRTQYSTQVQPAWRTVIEYKSMCCDGYSGDGEQCLPICESCIEPFLCVAPDICACPTEWTGDNCTEPPQNVVLVATGSDSLQISWEPPQQIGSEEPVYIVVCEFNIPNQTYIADNNHTMEVGSLSPHTTYTCCVIANSTLGTSSFACATQTTLETFPMDPPISITMLVVNSTAIEVEWSPPETPNGIIIYYTIYINAIPTLNISATVGNQSAVMEGLSPYQQVNVSISASNSAGEGPVSSQETVTTLETVPGVVGNMKVVALYDNLLHVSWDPPLSPNGVITGYLVTVTDLVNSHDYDYTKSPNIRQHNISNGIEPYIPYDVSVSATTSVGEGESVQVVVFSREGEPVTAVAFTSISRTKASTATIEWGELSWKDLRGVLVSYEIGYNSVGPGDKCSVADSDYSHTMSVHQERDIVTDLEPGLQYCVWVAAKTSAGIGPFNQALIPWYTNSVFIVVLEKEDCTVWISNQQQRKIDDLVREISRGIEQFCLCNFPSNYIADKQLTCDTSNPNLVLFQGRLISKDDRDSSTLASDLDKWVSSNPKVVIQGELVQVTSRDAPRSSTEQQSGAVRIVGTTVGVAILLILVVVTTISVVACYRHKRHNSNSSMSVSNPSVLNNKKEYVDRYSSHTLSIKASDYEVPIENTNPMKVIQPQLINGATEDENIYEDPEAMDKTDSNQADYYTTMNNNVSVPDTAGGVDEDDELYTEMQGEEEEEKQCENT